MNAAVVTIKKLRNKFMQYEVMSG